MEKNLVRKILFYLHAQFKDSYFLLKNRNTVEAWIFFIGGEREFLPILTAHLLKKPVLLYIPGSAIRDLKFSKDPLLKPTEILSAMVHHLADHIILYSPNLISEWNLEPHRHKIIIANRHFLDFNLFTVTLPFTDRPHLIGYIGRLSGEKGVRNFALSLPSILGNHENLRILIAGNGQLKEVIEIELKKEGLTDKVDLPDWISHDDLPGYLNRLRLLVLPSYTEGLPNIVLEAMACGTPVLATPVGAIPDIIQDGKTGFIMENNSPECIAENVERALSSPHLEKIANNGRLFVEENFTLEKTVNKWKEILDLL
jgi:glycosyltransferase involved in cell wall biosynthesis